MKILNLDYSIDSAATVLTSMLDPGMKKRRRDGGDEESEYDFEDERRASMGGIRPKFCFTEADDRKILEACANYAATESEHMQTETGILKKWQYVADYLNNGATAHQVGRRWREKLDPALSMLKSGTFSSEEDEKLLRLIEEHSCDGRGGGKNWTLIAAKLNRRAKECEHRGATLLAKHHKQGSFSADEDELLLRLHSEGKTFNEIGRILNRKPKRCADRL